MSIIYIWMRYTADKTDIGEEPSFLRTRLRILRTYVILRITRKLSFTFHCVC